MTAPGPNDKPSVPWGEWLRQRPVTLWIIPVIALLVVGISVMSDYSARVNRQLERLQTAQSDNTTWIISQLEVDILRLRTVLADATALPAEADAREALIAVRRAFDIAYSRVAVIDGSEFELESTGDARLAEAWDWLRGFTRDFAPVIDQPDAELRADLPRMRAEMADKQDLVRYYAVTGLQEMIRRSNEERLGLKTLLSNFSMIAVVMILLLAGIVWVLALLHRSLEHRAKMAERAISNLRTMIEASLDAVIVLDTAGRVTHFNSAAAMIFGYSREEAQGRNMAEMFLPERFREDHRKGMERFLATGQGAVANKGRVLLTAQRRDGREFPVEAAIVSDRNADGDPIFIGFVRDVSDRIRIENTLRQARDDAMQSARAKSRFLAVMSHEMRTPLNGVIAALDVIERTTRLSAKQAQFLSIARSCSATALEQIGDVLELTRMEDGQTVDRAVAFDPAKLLGDIVAQSQPLAKARGNTLAFRIDPALAGRRLTGYQRLLSRVLINLVGNAIKFTENGRVTVRAQIEEEAEGSLALRFEVTDTGIGIPFDKQTRIFENFETLDNSYSRTAEGTGLGLGIARRAVESMGGEIGVVSSLGKGSTFWFTARFQPAPDAEPSAPAEDPAAPARRRAAPSRPTSARKLDVLVAEDNEINRIVLREMLQTLGHRTVMAENGRRAVQAAGQSRFDVILMDISMPEMDGLEASERIRTSGGPSAQAALVAVTAHALREDIAEFASHGLTTVLTKPVTFDQLVRTLAAVVGDDIVPAEAAPVAAPASSVLDREVLDEAREMLGPEGFAGLAARYLAETEDRVATILDQIRRDAAEGLPESIHIVAGSSAVMGAAQLAGLMRRLEGLARSQGAAALAPHLEEIAATWAATAVEIAGAAGLPEAPETAA